MQQSITAALAMFTHNPAQRGQKTARAVGEVRVKAHCEVPEEPPLPLGSTRLRFLFVRPVSVESPVVDMHVHGEHAGAARVRRERKMRSLWRHEQMAIQKVLTSVQYHSHGVLRN